MRPTVLSTFDEEGRRVPLRRLHGVWWTVILVGCVFACAVLASVRTP